MACSKESSSIDLTTHLVKILVENTKNLKDELMKAKNLAKHWEKEYEYERKEKEREFREKIEALDKFDAIEDELTDLKKRYLIVLKERTALKEQLNSAPAEAEAEPEETCCVCYENTNDDYPTPCGHKLCMTCFTGICNSIPHYRQPQCPCCRQTISFQDDSSSESVSVSESVSESEDEPRRRIIRCGQCGDEGHNRRSCDYRHPCTMCGSNTHCRFRCILNRPLTQSVAL